ncbi:hypothetical protein DL764_007274 [Monosporascus ibericus]|uniref:Peptidase M43 pregnancy-associated plasma-A domain-containing protein n=1 Tax=Monosporascus ibericus TaxID=155417 RepID=A0A4Q4T2F2_9PEZI|nr:hypothetical protein DL764_007274 [Monosporascus ibericus]
MQVKRIAAAAAALLTPTSAVGLPKKQGRGWCATEATEGSLRSIAALRETELASRSDPSSLRPRQAIVIPTYLHVVVNSSASASVLGEEALRVQLDAMNERFGPHDIRFALEGTTRRVDDALAPGPYGGVEAEPMYAYWRETHAGGYDTLNLWFYSNFPWDIFGACTLPEQNYPESRYYRDGCHIASGTIPGGEIADYNLGLTAVHEIGHWLGLLHTFEGYSCSGPGDLVDDTPQQAEATSGCPRSKDSCPGVSGADPISNYMDYSSDPCFEEFTPGQERRMRNMWTTLREGRTA